MRVPVPEHILPAEQLGRVHFIGIGGAGLSAIARVMLARGIQVSGSDGADSSMVAALREEGATVYVGHDASQVDGVDTLIVSTAIREDNPEYVAAVEKGLRIYPRSAGLASVMEGRRVLAVAGTHGKTTTTSLLTVSLQAAGAAPTYTVGGRAQGNFGPLELGAQIKRTGPRYVNDQNLPVFANGVQVYGAKAPAYTLVDLDARYSLEGLGLNDRTWVQLSITNLFDKLYVGGFSSNTSNTSIPFAYIGSPRTISGTINFGF